MGNKHGRTQKTIEKEGEEEEGYRETREERNARFEARRAGLQDQHEQRIQCLNHELSNGFVCFLFFVFCFLFFVFCVFWFFLFWKWKIELTLFFPPFVFPFFSPFSLLPDFEQLQTL